MTHLPLARNPRYTLVCDACAAMTRIISMYPTSMPRFCPVCTHPLNPIKDDNQDALELLSESLNIDIDSTRQLLSVWELSLRELPEETPHSFGEFVKQLRTT